MSQGNTTNHHNTGYIHGNNYTSGDPLTKTGAERLVETIKQFWKDKGKEVNVWAERFVDKKTYTHGMFQVRSNMIGGLPK